MIALKLKIEPATVSSLNDFGFGFLQDEHFQSPLWVAGLSCMVGMGTSKVIIRDMGLEVLQSLELQKKPSSKAINIRAPFSVVDICVFC